MKGRWQVLALEGYALSIFFRDFPLWGMLALEGYALSKLYRDFPLWGMLSIRWNGMLLLMLVLMLLSQFFLHTPLIQTRTHKCTNARTHLAVSDWAFPTFTHTVTSEGQYPALFHNPSACTPPSHDHPSLMQSHRIFCANPY